jgi:hypothetical protein
MFSAQASQQGTAAMSWDIYVMEIPPEVTCVDDLPKDYDPGPIGTRAEIVSKITEICPIADFSSGLDWGTISGPGLAIDVNIGEEEPVMCVAFHIYGGEAVAGVVADILDGLGHRAFECGGGSKTGFFDRATADASFRQWREYRDHVVKIAKGGI